MRPPRLLVPVALSAALAAGLAACGSEERPAGTPAPVTSAPAPSAAGTTPGAASPPAPPTGPTVPAGTRNGVEALPAEEIVRRSQEAVRRASSVRTTGTASQGQEEITVAARVAREQGTGDAETGGGSLEVVRQREDVYLRGDQAFWKEATGQDAVGKLLDRKWMKAKADDPLVGVYASFVDYGQVEDSIMPQGSFTKVGEKTVQGNRAVALEDSADKSVLLVALDGEPFPVSKTSAPGAKDRNSLEFRDWNAPVEVEVPDAAQTVDVREVAKLAR